MKALTLQQPWAFAIFELGKDVENRTWAPPAAIIGQRIAIHAGKKHDQRGDNALRQMLRAWDLCRELDELNAMPLQYGSVLGTVEITGYARRVKGPIDGNGAEQIQHFPTSKDWSYPSKLINTPWAASGQYQWGLETPRALLEPIPAKGAQGLWTLPDEIAAQIASEAGQA